MKKFFQLDSLPAKILAVLLLFEIGFAFGLVYYFSATDIPFVFYKLEKTETNGTENIITKSYLEDIFNKTVWPEKSDSARISGLIVNHHLLAGQLIARGLYLAATDSPLTIALLSPNHFNRGYGQITVAQQDWRTPIGYLSADRGVIDALAKNKVAEIDDRPFESEHGVTNILPFIRKLYPRAKIVPIIIKDGLSTEAADQLAKNLFSILPENSLVVASLDFSHYRTSAEADSFDRQTLKIIQTNDYQRTASLNRSHQPDNVDSVPTLRVMLELMSLKAANFILLDHTNSIKIVGAGTAADNTSYIVGAFYK